MQAQIEQGWGPVIVTATGPPNDPIFATVFQPITFEGWIPLVRYGLTKGQMNMINNNIMIENLTGILRWADSYGTPDDTRYVALWYHNPNKIAWDCDALDDDAAIFQQRYDAVVSAWLHPVQIAITPSGKYLGVFADNDFDNQWVLRHELTEQQVQPAELDPWKARGFTIVRIATKETPSGFLYTIPPRYDLTAFRNT